MIGKGVTKVTIHHHYDTIEELTTKDRIVKACMDRNKYKYKYKETMNTSCILNPLRLELQFYGNTKTGREILNGTYIPPQGMAKYTKYQY